jgi:hypothetical protein
MKLLRVGTDDNNCIFDMLLNESLTIPPNSKIGLLNFTGQINRSDIEINGLNNQITYQICNDVEFTATLTNEIYGYANYEVLLDDITLQLNQVIDFFSSAVTSRNPLLGVEWRCITDDQKIKIQYAHGKNGLHWSSLKKSDTVENFGPDDEDDTIGLGGAVASTTDYINCMLGKKYLSEGNGYIRAKVAELVVDGGAPAGLEGQGFILGISSTDLNTIDPDDFTDEYMTYCVGLGYNGANWEYYTKQGLNAPVGTGILSTFVGLGDPNNGSLEVMINGTEIVLAIYDQAYNGQPDSRQVLNFNIPNDGLTKYYPFVVYHSNVNRIATRLNRWTPSPFYLSTVEDTDHFLDFEGVTYTAPYNRLKAQDTYLEFASQTLADFLGYDNSRIPQQAGTYLSKINHIFVADAEFEVMKLISTYMLELLNLNVESYDSTVKQRKNLLAGIITADQSGVINYQGNVIFIDLNNKNTIDLRNLKMRLVGLDYTPVLIEGKALCTLLIADKDEKSF